MDEKYYQINPIVSDAIVHNFRIISHIRSVTSIFFGLVAGILNLTSYYGLLFYIFGTFFVSLIIFFILTKRRPSLYFLYQREIWTKDVFSGLLSFMLSCTLSYNLVYVVN
ncbi:hypothetical protein MERGE_002021 [Pneumocystis wakefieldiae]|uniref:ER membrane protein complex subunit 6 n=1 Tax=Pneumocystis wakefieldiae TaxID=38082 RepID=A0A899FZN1_9ASCO|nr:hypothetical protein MERGE_002021 [Pneumocystis wakefieldiae]